MSGRDVPGGSALRLGVAVAACLAAPAAIAAGAPDVVRAAAVLALFAVAPGLALVVLLGGRDARAGAGLVVGLSLGVTVVVATISVLLGVWDPEAAVYGLAALSLAALTARGWGMASRAPAAREAERRRAGARQVPTGLRRGPDGAAQ